MILKKRAYLHPDEEMNRHVGTVILAPMTSKGRNDPMRVACEFQGVEGKMGDRLELFPTACFCLKKCQNRPRTKMQLQKNKRSGHLSPPCIVLPLYPARKVAAASRR